MGFAFHFHDRCRRRPVFVSFGPIVEEWSFAFASHNDVQRIFPFTCALCDKSRAQGGVGNATEDGIRLVQRSVRKEYLSHDSVDAGGKDRESQMRSAGRT